MSRTPPRLSVASARGVSAESLFVDNDEDTAAASLRPLDAEPTDRPEPPSSSSPRKKSSRRVLGRTLAPPTAKSTSKFLLTLGKAVKFGIEFITRNGQLTHATPVGPPADVNELEYISALHQCTSMQYLRHDGSITSEEIALFLKSRHGLDVDADVIRNVVVQNGLTADIEDSRHPEHDDVVDLSEIASMLIIPNLLRMRYAGRTQRVMNAERVARTPTRKSLTKGQPFPLRGISSHLSDTTTSNGEASPPPAEDVDILKDVLSSVLEDCTGDSRPKPLNEDLVRDILHGFGEGTLANDDDLVREMVQVASEWKADENVSKSSGGAIGGKSGRGGRGRGNAGLQSPSLVNLDVMTFVEGLTSDVARTYDPARFERHSTHFQDAWMLAPDDGDGDCGGGGCRCESCRDLGDTCVCLSRGETDEELGGARGTAPRRRSSTALEQQRLIDTLGQSLAEKMGCCRRLLEKCSGKKRPPSENGPLANSVDASKREPSRRSLAPHEWDSRDIRVTRLFTGQSIDYTAETYRTRIHVLFLWTAFAAFWFAYLGFGILGGGYDNADCDATTENATVTCPLVGGIINQLLMISELIVFGTPFIILGSVGNSVEGTGRGKKRLWLVSAGIFLFALYICVFFFFDFRVEYWISTESAYEAAKIASIGCGAVVVAMQSFHVLMVLLRRYFKGKRWYQMYFNFGNVGYEAKIKRSALFKVDRMMRDAHDVHRKCWKKKAKQAVAAQQQSPGGTAHSAADSASQLLSNFGMALNEYMKMIGTTSTTIGGIAWTWKKMRDGTLFDQEGIWISERVAVGTVYQIVVIFATPTVSIVVLPEIFDRITASAEGGTGEDEAQAAYRTKVALTVGMVFAFLTSVLVTVLFIPTMVATTMKFRRGVLPSLRSENFLHRYRFALDQASLVYGGMFWGVMFSSIAIAFIMGGFVYLLLWKQTSQVVLGLVGNLLGLSIVLVTKLILMQIIRFTHYSAFYRVKPLSTNIMTIVMECYSIGISVWFMVVRSIKIIVIGALYLGRIDTPLFSGGVGIFGPLELDNWPTVTRKEILIHEAHRHPYLETLGYLYMMQLRYRNGFAKRACSAWRLIFVLALMPWLHKYRDLTKPEHFGDEEDEFLAGEDAMIFSAGHRSSIIISPSPHSSVTERKSSRRRSSCMLKQSMVSIRWNSQISNEAAKDSFIKSSLDDALVKSPFGSPVTDKHRGRSDSEDLERIMKIKQEMERLQNELSVLETRVGIGIDTSGSSTRKPSIALFPVTHEEGSLESSP